VLVTYRDGSGKCLDGKFLDWPFGCVSVTRMTLDFESILPLFDSYLCVIGYAIETKMTLYWVGGDSSLDSLPYLVEASLEILNK
jgi:hypothetical protein